VVGEVKLDGGSSYYLRSVSMKSSSEVAVLTKMFQGTNQLCSPSRQGQFIFDIHKVCTWFLRL
jgi:hypothetical protein